MRKKHPVSFFDSKKCPEETPTKKIKARGDKMLKAAAAAAEAEAEAEAEAAALIGG